MSHIITRRNLLTNAVALPAVMFPFSNLQSAENERGIVGQEAPELNAQFWLDGSGEKSEFSMTAQRGKWVYLKCWQSWCPGCHSHGFPTLQKITDAFAGDDRVITLAVQTVFEGHETNTAEKVRETQERYDLDIFMGHDPGKANESGYPNTMLSYRTGGTPWQVLIAPDGTVVFDGFRVDPEKLISVVKEQLA